MTVTEPAHPTSRRTATDPFGTVGPLITLEPVEATEWTELDHGGVQPTDTCGACPDPVDHGQYVVRLADTWMHVDCGQKLIDQTSDRELLLTLASHMSYNPSKYTAGMIRWVLRQLLRVIASSIKPDS